MIRKNILSVITSVSVLIGIFISESCNHPDEIKKNPTFSEDIAPIIFKNCAPCHHPGEAGPFSLLT